MNMHHDKRLSSLKLPGVILCGVALLFFFVSQPLADDHDGNRDFDPASPAEGAMDAHADYADETPSFSNPAQAQHAAQLAEEVAARGNAEIDAAQAAVDAAEADLANTHPADPAYFDLEKNLEATVAVRDGLVAELTGLTINEIADMRAAGMGLGDIAHELGVHPGLLGLGHTKGKQKAHQKAYAAPREDVIAGSITANELNEATRRNTGSGWAKGHGVGMDKGVHSPGTGLTESFALSGDKKGKKSGISGAAGLASGQGNASESSGHGGGNSSSSGSGKGGSNSSSGKGVAGPDGSPGGDKGNSSDNSNSGKDKGGKSNNGKGGDKGNGKK